MKEKARAAPLFQVGLDGMRLPTGAQLGRLRKKFASVPALRLPGLLSPDLCRYLLEQIARFRFLADAAYDRPRNFKSPEVIVARTLSALLSEPTLCEAVGAVTARRVRTFSGVFSRHIQGGRQPWHGDIVKGQARVAGLAVNLSARPFEGGQFQLRRKHSVRPLATIPYEDPGDGCLFEIDRKWQHRGAPVLGPAPKILFVGFFYSGDAAGRPGIFRVEPARGSADAAS